MRMASAAKAARNKDEGEGAAAAAAPAKGRSPLLLMLGCTVLAAAMSGGVSWFVVSHHAPAPAADGAAKDGADDKDKEKDKAPQPAVYLDLNPAFVVNLADEETTRFLQVEVQLMARDPKVIEAAKNNLPRIRNALIMLFSQQHSRDLSTRESKENLQKQALEEVQKALQGEHAPDAIEAYFTSFVMQ